MPSPRIGLAGNVVRDMMLPERNGDGDDEGRGNSAPRKRRTRRPPITDKGRGRNLKIPDSVFRRLELEAVRLSTDNSKLVTKILDRELPRDIKVVVGDVKQPTE
jgi:hypothetical protein